MHEKGKRKMKDNLKNVCIWYFIIHFISFLMEFLINDNTSTFLHFFILFIPIIGLIGVLLFTIRELKLDAEERSNEFYVVSVLVSIVFILMILQYANRL